MTLPFVLSIPHCSHQIPEEMRPGYALTRDEILESVDLGTRRIFGSLPVDTVLCAEWSRLVADLNRSPLRMDARGVIPRVDYHGRPVFQEGWFPGQTEIRSRLEMYYFPFHKRLREALARPDTKGLLDCHSLNGIGPRRAPDAGKRRKDIVLGNNGDRNGNVTQALGMTTCPAEILHLLKECCEAAGFSVALNDPYPGGFITTHYGPPLNMTGKIAVQVEINQDLFLNAQDTRTDPEKIEPLKTTLAAALDQFVVKLGWGTGYPPLPCNSR